MRVRVPNGGDDEFAAGDRGVTEQELAASRLPLSPPVLPGVGVGVGVGVGAGVGIYAGCGGPPRRPLPRSPDIVSSSSASSLSLGYDGRLQERMSDKEKALEMANQDVAGAAVRLEEQHAELESLRARDRAMCGCTEPVPSEIMCPITCDISECCSPCSRPPPFPPFFVHLRVYCNVKIVSIQFNSIRVVETRDAISWADYSPLYLSLS